MNRLGDDELKSADADSWTTRGKNNLQILFWNFTPPITTESNQVFYQKDVPTKNFGEVQLKISNVPTGNYRMNVYQIGYQVNDVYADYLKLNSPQHLSREQVRELSEKNNGKPIESSFIKINSKHGFTKEINVRENDVFMVTLERTK